MYAMNANGWTDDASRTGGTDESRLVDAVLAQAFEMRTANLIAHLNAGFMTPGEVPALVAEIRERLGQASE